MSNPLTLTGLSSGFDWGSVVDQLIQIERIPQTKLRTEKESNKKEISTLGDLESKLKALQGSVESLNTGDLFSSREATVSGLATSFFTAKADTGALSGTYNFQITKLATQTRLDGADSRGAALDSTGNAGTRLLSELPMGVDITEGSFSVNGQEVTVALTDTLDDVFAKINTATGGAVTASYDSASDTLQLSSASEIVLGNPNDSSNFLLSAKLFSNGTGTVASESSLGAVLLNDPIASANLSTAITNVDGDGNGSFTINGTTIDYNVNTDSINDVLDRINSSSAKVSASYDSTNDRFVLRNTETGSYGVSVTDSAGGLGDALGWTSGTTTLGADARFTVDGGGELVSHSNVLDESVHGITGLSVTATSEGGGGNVTVGTATEDIKKEIEGFVKSYNDVQDFLRLKTTITVSEDDKVTSGQLADNLDINNLSRSLRTAAFSTVGSLSTEAVKRLQDMGIDFVAGTNKLEIKDESALEDAIENNLSQMETLFTDATTGIATKFDSLISNWIDNDGTLDTMVETLNTQNNRLDDQIEQLERYIAAQRERLTNSFLRMEQAQAEIQSQSQALAKF